ncbi:MAG: FtsW/RodA/SpoVE family cell cycle protein, partial [Clostridia bacterium]|nr:FtsW/RodA/SpoVE family cell cycle protein [Clostridia bacterium]
MIKSYKNSIIIFICTIILVVTGVVMVYSASKYSAGNMGNKYFYMTKQLIGAILGLGAMIVTSMINHKIY